MLILTKNLTLGEKVIGMCNNLFRGYIKTKTFAFLVSTLS